MHFFLTENLSKYQKTKEVLTPYQHIVGLLCMRDTVVGKDNDGKVILRRQEVLCVTARFINPDKRHHVFCLPWSI